MSLRALHSAGTGMTAFQVSLDTVANNLANAGTTAFKRSRVNFEDLFYDHYKLPGAQDAQGNRTATGVAVGFGTQVASTQVDHKTGGFLQTGGELDLAIAGDGFFPVTDGSGPILYSRSGTFSLNADGQIVIGSANRGRLLDPAITIPSDTTNISISADGTISVLQAGSNILNNLGQIQIARFINPQGLIQRGENLYAESSASGPFQLGNPGTEGRGDIRQGVLETSNVEPVQELVDLIKTQRNFELNTQVIKAADELLQMTANLRRF
ncbi:Flagellar basal-body rod protein FlgG [hydrothermal vent metagenome]|uniref:Flagellar basal-body rod protein FlgG n=1 Tax=hydrothermal vent metagenome TaxID=652676 RepID=A0A3B1E1L9_9ZZZZ